MPTRLLQLLNILGLLGVLVVNYLANALPINGMMTGEVSAAYPNLFTPAGITFSIWGLIYLLLLIFVVLQARGLFGRAAAPDYVEQIGWWFVLSCIFNMLWILVWHHLQIPLSFLLILALLGALIVIFTRTFRSGPFWVRLAFSVYLGWISVATIANTTILLVHLGWNGAPYAGFWWGLVIAVAFILAVWMLWQLANPWFALVVAWAFFGIYLQRALAGDDIQGNTALLLCVLLVLGVAVHFIIGRKSKAPAG